MAEALVGKVLVRADGRAARLVEVEAYGGRDDPGSHAFRGPTPRASIMFGPPGRLYVYFSYGVHWCANVVCGAEGTPTAVLLRAARPLSGLDIMGQARAGAVRKAGPARTVPERDLCRGPGRLCQAFSITGTLNGSVLGPEAGLWLADDGTGPEGTVVATPRVGLTQGALAPWRYLALDSRWVSGPRGASDVPAPGSGPGDEDGPVTPG